MFANDVFAAGAFMVERREKIENSNNDKTHKNFSKNVKSNTSSSVVNFQSILICVSVGNEIASWVPSIVHFRLKYSYIY